MRILIVEDDRKVGGFLVKGLREEQYAVDLCREGEEAVHQAEVESYDVIILDIMLPGMDGFEICRDLREKRILTPILMLTAKDSLEDKVTGLAGGADDYLTKPFSFEELLARIRALMRRDKDYKTGVLKSADLELDPMRRTVFRGDRTIELTAKEYALLEYLMRNQGRIVTQTQILDHVWDRDYEGTSNVVNVYLNRLREKINKGFKTRLIKTVRGIGFTIEGADKK
jgi:two-component system copper resistance phosphate regulon response regulator CusR